MLVLLRNCYHFIFSLVIPGLCVLIWLMADRFWGLSFLWGFAFAASGAIFSQDFRKIAAYIEDPWEPHTEEGGLIIHGMFIALIYLIPLESIIWFSYKYII